jgi:hypothetical protein
MPESRCSVAKDDSIRPWSGKTNSSRRFFLWLCLSSIWLDETVLSVLFNSAGRGSRALTQCSSIATSTRGWLCCAAHREASLNHIDCLTVSINRSNRQSIDRIDRSMHAASHATAVSHSTFAHACLYRSKQLERICDGGVAGAADCGWVQQTASLPLHQRVKGPAPLRSLALAHSLMAATYSLASSSACDSSSCSTSACKPYGVRWLVG